MSSHRLEIVTLGGLQIRRAGERLTGFRSRKERALLVYLAVEPRPHSRAALAGLLWSDMPQARALGNLRRVLSNLRRLVGDHLRITPRTAAVNPHSDYWLDVSELVAWESAESGTGQPRPGPPASQLANLYRGDFLAGFYVRNAPLFEEWVLVWRERLRTIALRALYETMTYHSARGEYTSALRCAEQLLHLDPWREEVHREMMHLLTLTGQRSAALRQYETCRRLLQEEFGIEPMDETTALYKRIAEAETVASLTATPPPQHPTPLLPFIGRGDEHALLLSWWQDARRGHGKLTLVEGEAGVGKTRLVEEVLRYAASQGVTVLHGRCYEFGGGLPYQPIATALRSMDNGRWTIDNIGAVWLAEVSRLLPELRQNHPDLPPPAPSSEASRQRLFEAVARFVPPSCILFLDDLHWADQSTLDLLHYLVRRLSDTPTWIVGTYRPEEVNLSHPLTRLRQGLSRDHLVNHLALGPLPNQAVDEMACALVGQESCAALGEFLYRESEGNPFILVETVSSLQERGMLRGGEEGHWRWDGPAAMPSPRSVRDVVLQRVGRMDAAAQRLLALAAAIGRQFDLPLLQAAAGPDADAVEGSLHEWQRRRLVSSGAPGVLDFAHDKIRTIVYHATDSTTRRTLHRQIGEALERLFPDPTAEQVGLLAHHWEQARVPEKASTYLLRAGDHARLLYAHQEATDYYRRALTYLKEQGQHEQAARTLTKLGLTYHNAFDFQQARRAYDEGFVLWQQAGATHPTRTPPPAPHPLRVRWLEPTALDPAMAPDAHTSCLIAHLFSGLVELSPEMDIVPDVARTWEVSEGGRRFVFHLRDDARWSDGTAVTAGDFEYAWKRVLAPDSGSPAAYLLYALKGGRAFHQAEGDSVGVRALDDHTLLVELERPMGYFLQLLTHVSWLPVPRQAVETYGETWAEGGNLVSNGPFRLQTWRRGEAIILARNPAYHNLGRIRGNVQQVNLFPLTDWASRLEMYEADELDVLGITFFPPAERDAARQEHIGEYVSIPRLETHFLAFDVQRPPFDDVRVRRAFVLATDRERLADMAMRGYVAPATGGLVPPGMPGHAPGVALPYDPQQARRLLAEAGYPDGRGFPAIAALAFRAVAARSEYLRAQWQENLGVDIAWQTVGWSEFLDRLENWHPHLTNLGWVADYPDPDNFLRVSRARSWSRWQNATYDRLVEEAGQAMCQEERMELYRQAGRILVEEAPILPLIYEREHLLVKPWVSRYPMSAIKPSFWKDVVIEPHR